MRIFIIPTVMGTVDKMSTERHPGLVFLHRPNEKPYILMHHVQIHMDDDSASKSMNGKYPSLKLCGDIMDGKSFSELKDGDRLFFTMHNVVTGCREEHVEPFYIDMELIGDDMLVPFKAEPNVLSLAAAMESSPGVYISGAHSREMLERAVQVCEKADMLYVNKPSYKNIMLKKGDGMESISLLRLASMQDVAQHDMFVGLFLSASNMAFSNLASVGTNILEHCKFEEEFSLLTQEEQVGTFIEFSRLSSKKKLEYVPDSLISSIEKSPEYARVKEDLKKNGLGISQTQQFNVFQQVGFFSNERDIEIMYNLSDMGAGKTLMTVEAIYLLDLKQISSFEKEKGIIPEDTELMDLYLPDKHIIAPTLSVKSSWIDTFRLFYGVSEVEGKEGLEYELSIRYHGYDVKSRIYVAPFTVKDGKIFVKEKLPYTEDGSYLIIDEIHQLVHRNIEKTKFFQPKTVPVDRYRIFVLSGTMSNMKTVQWYNFMRFMGMKVTASASTAEAGRAIDVMYGDYAECISESAKNLRANQFRYFDKEPIKREEYYIHHPQKKQTKMEQEFFTRYSTQIIVPDYFRWPESGMDVEDVLTNRKMSMLSDHTEIDNINFELFYSIVGSHAVTAQSMQVAEELFGEQKNQHTSDIIKTVSPLSPSDIQILKVLHHIAGDYSVYKSQSIAKAINNAILNLNDGLATKNIYDIVSGFAEHNVRFFEYLAGLDVKILEMLPQSGLIEMPRLEDTDKFKVLKDILEREKDETHWIVVNDFYALKKLSEALGIEHLTRDQLKRELDYQETLDGLFERQSVVIVTQDMIKSSLDLVQANRLIQYQLNTEISDIIQTQNRINRIGQTRETRGYYIATDQLQENLIELFLESYRNIRVAHKGIVELFTDITSEVNIINDYLERAIAAIESDGESEPGVIEEPDPVDGTDLCYKNPQDKAAVLPGEDGKSKAILFPQGGQVLVLVPDKDGNAFPLGRLRPEIAEEMHIASPQAVTWNLETDKIEN